MNTTYVTLNVDGSDLDSPVYLDPADNEPRVPGCSTVLRSPSSVFFSNMSRQQLIKMNADGYGRVIGTQHAREYFRTPEGTRLFVRSRFILIL